MAAVCFLMMFWASTSACVVPDYAAAPIFVEIEAGGNDVCKAFDTLEAALKTLSSLPATVFLKSAAQLPSWTVSNKLIVSGNYNSLAVIGAVSIPGSLSFFNVSLQSNLLHDFPLSVVGTLTLTNCQLTGFAGLPILLRGEISVSNSTFKDNPKGVFSSTALGGRLTVSQSLFLTNAGTSGAVFSISPISGSESTNYSISTCRFERNGVGTGSGVLLLNDLGAISAGAQTISFSKCNFTDHSATTFTITTKLFNVDISDCLFERETKLIAGTLLGTNMTVSRISVTRSKGPLFVLTFSGVFNLTKSSFTYISTGPLVTVLGQSVPSSLVCLSQVRVFNISNLSPSTYGNLINAVSTTVWLQTVTIDQFEGNKAGVFAFVACLLFSRDLNASHATSKANGVGTIYLSTVVMNDTRFEAVNSAGSMTVFYGSSGNITSIHFKAIQGLWQPLLGVYSTNLMNINGGSSIVIEAMNIKLESDGTPLIFVRDSRVTIRNSSLAGALGKAFISVQNSAAVLRGISFDITQARMLAYGLLNARLDFDDLSLRDMFSLLTLFSLSSGSSVRIGQLSLVNVTTQGLSKGPLYAMTIDAAYIERSTIEALIYFSISVNVTIGNLVMRNTAGSLFCAVNSNLLVSQASILNLTVPRMFLYLVLSTTSVSMAVLDGLTFVGAGGFATVLSHSLLQLTTVSMHNVAGIEHGVLSLDNSALALASSNFSQFNVSLILAQQSSVSILYTRLFDMQFNSLTTALSMVPSGGVVSCLNCASIVLAGVVCRNVSASKGGVISALLDEEGHSGSVLLVQSEFESCSARTSGGVVSTEKYTLRIAECHFRRNFARSGGVVNFLGKYEKLEISNSSFLYNSAVQDGSCIRWIGRLPTLTSNEYVNNSALYGNPLASDPHHFLLLTPGSLLPISQFPIQGVTGQRMDQPLLVGVFDILDQLILTDNSTFVSMSIPSQIQVMGNARMIAIMGVASLSSLFYPFSTSTLNFTFSNPAIANLTFPFHFRHCEPGEIQSLSGCFPCPKNSYSLLTADLLCRTCPAHVQCHGRAMLVLDPDYWRANNLTDVIYSCLVLGSCQGGFDSTCASGYTGTLCNSCTQGYFRLSGWMCIDCEREVSVVARGFVVALLLMSTSALLPQLYLRKESIIFRVALAFRIFLQHTQIIMFVAMLPAQWGFRSLVYHEVMRVLASIGGLWIFAGCQYEGMGTEQSYFQLIAVSFYPILFLLACASVWILVNCKQLRNGSDTLSSILAATWVCVYHYSPVFCLLVVGMWQCKEVEGRSLLVADMTQTCWTGSHLRYVLTVTVPLAVLLIVNHGIAVLCILKPPPSRVFAAFHSYLIAGLKEEQKHWELRMSLCRAAFAFLFISFPALEAFSSAILLTCVLGFCIQSYVKWRPYKQPIHNNMAVAGHLAELVIMFSGVQGEDVLVVTLACLCTSSVLVLGLLALRQPSTYLVSPESQAKLPSEQMKHRDTLFPLSSMEMSEASLKPPPPSLEVSLE